ncbi:unnamed protein product [Pedinophyceae sp. YPF-701]|nr:unnamed protein product [Pedinophyceae sp. YPF-701]
MVARTQHLRSRLSGGGGRVGRGWGANATEPEGTNGSVATAADAEKATSNGAEKPMTDEEKKIAEAVEAAFALEDEVPYVEPSDLQKLATSAKLLFARPWRRFKKGSVLTLKISGDIGDVKSGSPFRGESMSVPAICQALRNAAVDPRVAGVAIKIEPVAAGWGKLQELRRHLAHFNKSGKFSLAYMELGGEKEYYLACGCNEIYAPPSASLSLRGVKVAGTFLRGALEKAGVQPEVRRIGKYKSAGDQFLRKDMSEPQREQLTALLDAIYYHFCESIAEARGKTAEEARELLDRGVYEMETLQEEGWLTDLKYETDLTKVIAEKLGEDVKTKVAKGKGIPKVGFRKYARVDPSTFGTEGGRKVIAVVRAAGAITGTGDEEQAGQINSGPVIRKMRALRKDKRVAAIVLRVDSPGGSALASDLMWYEIQQTAKKKPVVASMADVAASGGYYMSMACRKIVCEPLTITGSIGVVTGKFSLQELYNRVGYAKETISRGRYANFLGEERPLTEDENEQFDREAQHAYESFRNKAAASRGMEPEKMQEYAQGRVWTGSDALERGLVDGLGGVNKAVAVAKAMAGIGADERVRVMEVSRGKMSPLQALSGGGASAGASPLLEGADDDWAPVRPFSAAAAALTDALARAVVGSAMQAGGAAVTGALGTSAVQGLVGAAVWQAAGAALAQGAATGQAQAVLSDPEVLGITGAGSTAAGSAQASLDGVAGWDGDVRGSI